MADSTVKYNAGDIIFEEGGSSDCLYIVKSGQVQISKGKDKTGKEHQVAIIHSGEFLAELSMLLETRHASTAKALTEVIIGKVTKGQFESQLRSMPPWILTLMKLMARRLEKTNEAMKAANVVDLHVTSALTAAEKRVGKAKLKKYGA